MLSYSPYDSVHVQYWESAKWVAKLRELKTDNHLLLLRTLMNASHAGASGRYEKYREKAFEYAFLLNLALEPNRAEISGQIFPELVAR